MRPFVKWAGGKRQLLAEIQKRLPGDIERRVYFEPFVGAGALFLELQPKTAVINDFNTELMLCYGAIKDHVEELIAALLNHRQQNSKDHYYEVRARDRDNGYHATGDIEKAARLIYLNKTCYNGLYRVNSRGYFNVPLGAYKNPAICEEALLREISSYLNSASVVILNTDFEEALTRAATDSFVYFDPPYHSSRKAAFSSYQAGGFDEEEQARLAKVLLNLTERGIPCLLSNADTPFIRGLYQNRAFEIISLKARRAINSDRSGRGRVNEVLIKNYG